MRGINVKKYVKPELFYERYELSEHIADCGWEWKNLVSEGTCYAEIDQANAIPGLDFRLFATYDICTVTREDVGDYCYQTGAPHESLFRS